MHIYLTLFMIYMYVVYIDVYMFRYTYSYTYNTYPLKYWCLQEMLISSKKTLAALTALAKEEENVGMINRRPEAVKDWWFQSVRAGYPLLALFLPVEYVFLNNTPREMGKTHRHIIWDLRETWLRSGMYFSSPNCQNIFKKTLTTRSGSLVELFLGAYPT